MKRALHIGIILLGLVLFCFPLIQHLQFENAIKNLNSDNALFSLMAEDIIKNHKIPIFFWGQNYMGPLTTLLIAFIHILLTYLNIFQVPNFYSNIQILPQAPILAASLLVISGHFFYYFLSKNFINRTYSAILFFILCSGNSIYLKAMTRPLGQEMGYCLSGLCFLIGYKALTKESHFQFIIGLLIGFSWWMNQNIIFSIAPLLVFIFLNNENLVKFIKSNLDLKNRFLGKRHNLQLLLIIHLILLIPLSIGIFTLFPGQINYTNGNFHIKINNALEYIKTPFLIFFIIQISLDIFNFQQTKSMILENTKKYYFFVFGFLIGYSPVLLGKILKWYPNSYGAEMKFTPILSIAEYWPKLILDYFPHVIFPNFLWLSILWYVLILYVIYLRKDFIISLYKLNKFEKNQLPFLSVIIFLTFSFVADRMRVEFAYRYSITFIPMFIILFFQTKKKAIKYTTIVFSTVFFFSNIKQIKNNLLELENFPSPRKELEYIYSQNMNHCYANYWDVYRLKYLSGNRLEFIPKNSQDRTLDRTERIKSSYRIDCEYDFNTKKIIKI